MRKTLKNISLVSIGVVAGVLATLQISATAQNTTGPLPLDQLRLMADIFGQIKREYVEPVDDKKLLTEAIKGMVASLDPHSAYLDEKDFKELQEGTRGRFAGLGIEISQEEGLVKVINPIEDTPAFRAGIQPGDLITRIDDKPVRGLPLEQAVKRMRGEPGTKVTLTIYRKSEERTFPVSITRAEIRVQSVKTKMLDNNTIGWVRLTSFQERTVTDLGRRLKEMAEEPEPEGHRAGPAQQRRRRAAGRGRRGRGLPARGFGRGIDQRPGAGCQARLQGVVQQLPPVVARGRSAQGPAGRVQEAADGRADQRLLGVGVGNRGRRAAGPQARAIMGKTTFGKGSVQTVRPLTNDTGIKLTIAYYYTPSGKSIQAKGIRPDIPVDQNPEGDPDDALITREIDTERHLHNKQESEEPEMAEREQRRVEELRRLEEENAKKTPEEREKERKKKPVEFGSPRTSCCSRPSRSSTASRCNARSRAWKPPARLASRTAPTARSRPARRPPNRLPSRRPRQAGQPAARQRPDRRSAGHADRQERQDARSPPRDTGARRSAFSLRPAVLHRRAVFVDLDPPMNDDQLLRYSRHILLDELGIEGQERLLAGHALVIGAGGLGAAALPYLASAGVGTSRSSTTTTST
jgi:carboxyl-terminal processing protease